MARKLHIYVYTVLIIYQWSTPHATLCVSAPAAGGKAVVAPREGDQHQ